MLPNMSHRLYIAKGCYGKCFQVTRFQVTCFQVTWFNHPDTHSKMFPSDMFPSGIVSKWHVSKWHVSKWPKCFQVAYARWKKCRLPFRDRRNTQRRNTQQAVAVLRAPQHATRKAFFRKAPATHFSCRNTQRCGVAALRFSYLQFAFITIFYW